MRGILATVVAAVVASTMCASASAQLVQPPAPPLPSGETAGVVATAYDLLEPVEQQLQPLVCQDQDPATKTCTIGTAEAGCSETIVTSFYDATAGTCTLLVLQCSETTSDHPTSDRATRSCGIAGAPVECTERWESTYGFYAYRSSCTVGTVSYTCEEVSVPGGGGQPYTCRPEGLPA